MVLACTCVPAVPHHYTCCQEPHRNLATRPVKQTAHFLLPRVQQPIWEAICLVRREVMESQLVWPTSQARRRSLLRQFQKGRAESVPSGPWDVLAATCKETVCGCAAAKHGAPTEPACLCPWPRCLCVPGPLHGEPEEPRYTVEAWLGGGRVPTSPCAPGLSLHRAQRCLQLPRDSILAGAGAGGRQVPRRAAPGSAHLQLTWGGLAVLLPPGAVLL